MRNGINHVLRHVSPFLPLLFASCAGCECEAMRGCGAGGCKTLLEPLWGVVGVKKDRRFL
jgi:hypothetical protein